jgi:hypothetical protein
MNINIGKNIGDWNNMHRLSFRQFVYKIIY